MAQTALLKLDSEMALLCLPPFLLPPLVCIPYLGKATMFLLPTQITQIPTHRWHPSNTPSVKYKYIYFLEQFFWKFTDIKSYADLVRVFFSKHFQPHCNIFSFEVCHRSALTITLNFTASSVSSVLGTAMNPLRVQADIQNIHTSCSFSLTLVSPSCDFFFQLCTRLSPAWNRTNIKYVHLGLVLLCNWQCLTIEAAI